MGLGMGKKGILSENPVQKRACGEKDGGHFFVVMKVMSRFEQSK